MKKRNVVIMPVKKDREKIIKELIEENIKLRKKLKEPLFGGKDPTTYFRELRRHSK
jgi:hypothetical protein